jgi:uncharacterized protein YodC (DUF2158 family)
VETFKRGAVVSLKSGGGLFTVESENANETGEKIVVCKYWSKKNDKVETIELFSDLIDIDRSNEPPQININIIQPESSLPISENEQAPYRISN